MSSVNMACLEIGIPSMYTELKMSIPQIAEQSCLPRSRVRKILLENGVELRSRAIAVAMASERISAALTGKKKEFSESWKQAISIAAAKRGEHSARGLSLKPSGYLEYTRGEHKGRSVHVVKMEQRIGRKLLPDECVHHIDGNRSNNDDNNLALMTRAGHTRLHRMQQRLLRSSVGVLS